MRARLVAALLPAVASVVLACTALPARAGMFDDEEARARVDKLRAEMTELAQRIDNASKNQLDFANQFESLRADISRLRGQVEVVTYDLEAAQKRQKDFYVDLDNRLRKLEGVAEAATKAAEPPKVDPVAETHDYEAALSLFRSAKYKDAYAGFAAFIKAYPDSTFQASAHYWAASSLYQTKEYGRAAELFGKVADSWPDDAKAPDARLYQSNALNAGGDAKNARKALELLVEKYPTSNAAQTARVRLKKR